MGIDVVQPGDLADDSPRVLAALQRSTSVDVKHLLDMWQKDLKPQLGEIRDEIREMREEHDRTAARLEARVEKLAVRVAVLEKALLETKKTKKRGRR